MSDKTPIHDRYARQRILPQIGPGGQDRLAAARVLLVGCGALGSGISELLVRAGVGFVRLVDRDLVELSNLQRQTLFDEQDAVGEVPKAVAAARRLGAVNSSVKVEPIVADVNPTNIESLVGVDGAAGEGAVDLILDGTDNISTRYLINDVAVKYGLPWIYGACVGMAGRVMAIWPTKTACLRCVFPQPPDAANLPTCDTSGVLGPAAAAVAAFQAATAIRCLVEPGYSAGLLSLDVWEGQMRTMGSASVADPDCPACARREFPFLSATADAYTTTLCGRKAVQVQRTLGGPRLSLPQAAERLANAGQVRRSDWFIKCRLHEAADIDLTLFPDGRLLVHGTTDPLRAKSLYARYIGT
jgi:molybdopterin-synthase adenylyltransferase